MRGICFYLLAGLLVVGVSSAYGGEQDSDWKKEYEAVCAETQGAVSTSVEKLREYKKLQTSL